MHQLGFVRNVTSSWIHLAVAPSILLSLQEHPGNVKPVIPYSIRWAAQHLDLVTPALNAIGSPTRN